MIPQAVGNVILLMLLKCVVGNESCRDLIEGLMHDDSMEEQAEEDSTRALGHADEWYPWHSRAVSCAFVSTIAVIKPALLQAVTLDIVANIPRSAFSMQQIQLMFWFLKANGAPRIPPAKTLRSQNAALHSMCGIRTLEYDGAFGHKFFINSLADTICQVSLNLSSHLACVHVI